MIHWNVDPIIFSLGPLHVRWYGLMFVIGFAISHRIFQWMCEQEKKSTEALDELLTYIILGTTIGARLGHCLFYEPLYFLQHPLEIFAIWQGGLASHGGGLGVIFAIWLFSRKHKEFALFWIIDRVAPLVALTGCLIRMGNLFNSEIIGLPTAVPWSFIFEKVDQLPRHPTQIYESLSYLLIAVIGITVYKKMKSQPPQGLLFGLTISLIFIFRMLWELLKENQEAFEAGMILNMGQLLSIPFILAGFFFIFRALRQNRNLNHKAGL